MKEFKGKVAVITGAASGIGRSIAERAAREGMKVVLADIEETALAEAAEALEDTGATVLAVRTDVSRAEDIQALARETLHAFGAVHLLFNNAGVGEGGDSIWETSLADWQWVIGVNLWGSIHGIRVFVPIMLAQDTECHIVNTASCVGLFSLGGSGPYTVSKYGIMALSETLYHNLARMGAKVKVSVLCPALTRTRFLNSERNRPVEYGGDGIVKTLSPEEDEARWAAVEKAHAQLGGVLSPDDVAETTFAAICNEQLYVLTHKEALIPLIRTRMEDIVHERNPRNP
jgi:NAD(P)-dependent dehydrogenase (short-subunit alcohol dehydrogenase family)